MPYVQTGSGQDFSLAWVDDPAPAWVAPSSINGEAVTNDGMGWTRGGTAIASGAGANTSTSVWTSPADSPLLKALGFDSWALANPGEANGVYDSSTQTNTTATDLFLKDSHLALYSKPWGAPGSETDLVQAVDDRTGALVGPQRTVSIASGDGLVAAAWLAMAGGFAAASSLLAPAAAVVDAAPAAVPGTLTMAADTATLAGVGLPEAAGTVGAWDAGAEAIATAAGTAGAAGAATAGGEAIESTLGQTLTDAATTTAPSALPSLTQLGQGAGLASSLVGLAKQILPPTSSPRSSSSTTAPTPSSSTAAAQRHGLLIVAALVAGAFLLRKKGAHA